LLEQFGIDRDAQIEFQLYDWFTHHANVDPDEPFDSINGRIERFLHEMQSHHHAKFEITKLRSEGNQDKLQVTAHLTVLGFQYLNEHRLRISNLRLNDTLEINTRQQIAFDQTIADNSVIQAGASRRQTRIFRWTAIFAFCAMAIAGVSLWRDFHKDTQSQLLLKKDSLISTLQKNLYHLKTDSSAHSKAMKIETKKP